MPSFFSHLSADNKIHPYVAQEILFMKIQHILT